MSKKELDSNGMDYKNDIDMVSLRRVYNSVELNFLENLLSENDIPYILKDLASGGYMRIYSGFSIYGTDILVESSTLEKARAIIDEFPLGE